MDFQKFKEIMYSRNMDRNSINDPAKKKGSHVFGGVSINDKEKMRELIAADTEKFLANGGAVNEVPPADESEIPFVGRAYVEFQLVG